MHFGIKDKITALVIREKALLRAGVKYPPLIKNRIQRVAVRLLAAFFILMLTFTVVSRIADTATIASVQTDSIKNGVLTDRTSIIGAIVAAEDTSLIFPEGLRVEKIYAKQGQEVNEGDPLLQFNTTELKKQVEAVEREIRILELKISTIQGSVSPDNSETILSAQQALDDAQDAYDRLVAKYSRDSQRSQEDYTALNSALEKAKSDYEGVIARTKASLMKAAEEAVKKAEKDLEDALTSADEETSAAQEAEIALAEAESKLQKAKKRTDFSGEAEVIAAQAEINEAEDALKSAQRGLEDQGYSREEELYLAEKAIENARRNLESVRQQAAEDNRNNTAAAAETEIELLTHQYELAESEKQRDILNRVMQTDGIITSPVNGTVRKTLEIGSSTAADADAVMLSQKDESYIFEGTLDSKNAEKLTAGDTGEITYTHGGSTQNQEVKIESIGIPDEEGNVDILIKLPEGRYPSGISAECTITKTSETYHNCLPLSALRSDAGGDYVLVLREKSTVMGTQWTVTRVDIDVDQRDSQLMTVEGTLSYSDKVIINSNKPISEGDRVRIES